MRPRTSRSSSPALIQGATLRKAARTGAITLGAPSQSNRTGKKITGSILGPLSSVQQVTVSISRGVRHTDIYTIIGDLHAGGGSFMPVLLEILKPLNFRNN